jgi:hypothetical protein
MIDLLTNQAAHPLVALTLQVTDPTPQPADVKAGWTAFVIFLLLGLAVVLLGISLVKQLKKAQAAKDAGMYGDEPKVNAPVEPTDGAGSVPPTSEPENHDQPSS